MATIDDLAAPEFAPIRVNLARLYLQHLADLGMADASDESVVAQVDDITDVLIGLTARALANQDRGWRSNTRGSASLASNCCTTSRRRRRTGQSRA